MTWFWLAVALRNVSISQRTQKTDQTRARNGNNVIYTTHALTQNYPEDRDIEQELDVEGDSGSVSPLPLYTGMRDLVTGHYQQNEILMKRAANRLVNHF